MREQRSYYGKRLGLSRIDRAFGEIFVPNGNVSRNQERFLYVVWTVLAIALWSTVKIPFIPQLQDVLPVFPDLWARQGLAYHAIKSLRLSIEALAWSTVISLTVCYLYPVAVVRPIAAFITKLRFLGVTSVFVFLLMILGSGHMIKLVLVILWQTSFFVTSMRDVVRSIPKEKYDHARTQGMGEWRVIYEVIVLGTFHQVLEVMGAVAAVSWGMVTVVEGISAAEGGLGVMLLRGNKHFKLEELFAISITIVAIGIITDFLLNWMKRTITPHSILKLERR